MDFLCLYFHFFALSSVAKTIFCINNNNNDGDDFDSVNVTFLETILKKLISDEPLVILLDDEESSLEPLIRPILNQLDTGGSVVYTYGVNVKGREVKAGTIGATDQVSFQWTFICLIEEKRSKQNANGYLNILRSIGHGRTDRFFLLGLNTNLSPYIRNSVVRFKNIIALGLGGNKGDVVYQRRISSNRFDKVAPDKVAGIEWFDIDARGGLSGHVFKISGTKFPPYLDIPSMPAHKSDLDLELDWGSDDSQNIMGVNYQIFSQGSKAYNFSFEFNPPEQWKETGKMYANGTWDGVFADLLNEKADIASVATQTPGRNSLADFVGPFGRTHLKFVTAHPASRIGKYAVFRSYSLTVWLLVVLYFFIFIGLLYQAISNSIMIDNLTRVRNKKRVRTTTDFYQILPKAWLIAWGIGFEQTVERRPIGTRVVLILWVVFVLWIGTGYRSNLAAKISFPQMEERPKTFPELERAREYKVYFDLNGQDAWIYFDKSTNQIIQSLRSRAIPLDNTSQCVLNSLMEPKSVCIGWDFTLRIAISQSMTISQLKDPLSFSRDAAWSAWYTFALAINSRFTESFQRVGQHFLETGLITFYRKRLLNRYRAMGINWTRRNTDSKQYRKLMNVRKELGPSEKKPFKVANFELVFLLWMSGLLLSGTIFLWEYWRMRDDKPSAKSLHLHRPSQQTLLQIREEIIEVEFVP